MNAISRFSDASIADVIKTESVLAVGDDASSGLMCSHSGRPSRQL